MDTQLAKLMPRGKPWPGTAVTDSALYDRVGLEGQLVELQDTDPSDTAKLRSHEPTTALIVRNVASVVLAPGRAVAWQSTNRGKRVDGYQAALHGELAGIVDDHVSSAGVPRGNLFFLIIDGNFLSPSPVAGAEFPTDWAAGDVLVAAVTTAATTGTTAGRLLKSAGTFTATQVTDGSAFRCVHNGYITALSARTTAETNTNTLCNIRRLR